MGRHRRRAAISLAADERGCAATPRPLAFEPHERRPAPRRQHWQRRPLRPRDDATSLDDNIDWVRCGPSDAELLASECRIALARRDRVRCLERGHRSSVPRFDRWQPSAPSVPRLSYASPWLRDIAASPSTTRARVIVRGSSLGPPGSVSFVLDDDDATPLEVIEHIKPRGSGGARARGRQATLRACTCWTSRRTPEVRSPALRAGVRGARRRVLRARRRGGSPRIAQLTGANLGATRATGSIWITDGAGARHECVGGDAWTHWELECALDSSVRYGKVRVRGARADVRAACLGVCPAIAPVTPSASHVNVYKLVHWYCAVVLISTPTRWRHFHARHHLHLLTPFPPPPLNRR